MRLLLLPLLAPCSLSGCCRRFWLTCALDLEVYKGPSDRQGRRHGEGTTCTKMDSEAKFLSRYHVGQIHSNILIVASSNPTNFTYMGTYGAHSYVSA